MMGHPTWMEIDTKQLIKNWQEIKKFIGKKLFCLPVKANAYGHGIVETSRLAEESGVVDYLGVSSADEAKIIREAKINLPIQVFGAFHQDQLPNLIKTKAEVTISSQLKAEMLYNFCKENKKKVLVHLEIETGTNRTGVRPASAIKVLEFLLKDEVKKHMTLKGVYTHLACAGDGPDKKESVDSQLKAFNEVKNHPILKSFKNFNDIIFHVANSGGLLFYPESYQEMQMVRPGILAYGLFDDHYQKEYFPQIKSAITLKSKLSFFKVVAAGSGIGYGHTYKTSQESRIVTVPIGYGDGYMRSLSHKAKIILRGKIYAIVGTINMDQFMVDIGKDEGYVGDEVVLVGKQGNEEITIFDLARWANTITYEIMCSFNDRIRHVYL